MVSLSIALATAIMGHSIMELLTSNPEIIRLGAILLIIDIVLEVGRAVNIFAVNSLLATGDAIYPCTIGVIFMWGIATAMGYLFGITWGWGIIGMWIAFTLDENIRAFFFVKRWYSKKWEKKGFVKIDHTPQSKAA